MLPVDLELPQEAPPNFRKILIFAFGILIVVLAAYSIVHAVRTNYWAGDDLIWLEKTSSGLNQIWTTKSPFSFFRPVFGTWLWIFKSMGLDSPIFLAVTGFLLVLISGLLAFFVFRVWFSFDSALFAAAVVIIHPVRQSHVFWISAQIDALCLVLSLGCLAIALRYRAGSFKILSGGLIITCLTAASILTKETAILLPLLVTILPGRSLSRRRLATMVFSTIGAVAPLVISFQVTDRIYKVAWFIEHINTRRWSYYLTHLLWPADMKNLFMRARLFNEYFPLIILASITLIFVIIIYWGLRRYWTEKWLWGGILLLLAGASIWLLDPSHRGIGLGCGGFSILITGFIFKGLVKKKYWLPLVMVLILGIFWAPSWRFAEKSWSEAKNHSRMLFEEYRSFKDQYQSPCLLVFIGGVYKINNLAWPLKLFELDNCTHSILMIRERIPFSTLSVESRGNGLYRFDSQKDTCFAMSCRNWPPDGIVNVTCLKGYPVSVDFDKNIFVSDTFGCGEPVFVYWDGSKFQYLKD